MLPVRKKPYILSMSDVKKKEEEGRFSSILYCSSMKGLSGMAEATIEGLAFPIRPSREPGLAGRRGCLSEASSAAAEKGGSGTALKT